MTDLQFSIVVESEFPWGLRCSSCDRVIDTYQPYTGSPEGVHPDGNPIESLICVYCI